VLKEKKMADNKIAFSCPVCGRTTDYPVEKMLEGTMLRCPFCKLNLRLHGHMWQDVQREIEKLKRERS
jgi:C4-type Zn-finger protein